MRTTRELPCALPQAEIEQAKMEQASKLLEMNAITQEARDAGASFRRTIKEMKKRLTELAGIALSGTSLREVECEEREGLTAGAFEVVRLDTGAVVQVLTAEEALGPLFADTGGTAKGKKKKSARDKALDDAFEHDAPGVHRLGEPEPVGDTAEDVEKVLGAEFSTGEPAIGIGDDAKKYPLPAALADDVRNGKTVEVQGEKGIVIILKLEKARRKSVANGAAVVTP